jgi:hypothetical protein
LFSEIGDSDPVPEEFIAAQPEFGFTSLRKAVSQLGQFLDQFVEGHLVRNLDEILDSSLH